MPRYKLTGCNSYYANGVKYRKGRIYTISSEDFAKILKQDLFTATEDHQLESGSYGAHRRADVDTELTWDDQSVTGGPAEGATIEYTLPEFDPEDATHVKKINQEIFVKNDGAGDIVIGELLILNTGDNATCILTANGWELKSAEAN